MDYKILIIGVDGQLGYSLYNSLSDVKIRFSSLKSILLINEGVTVLFLLDQFLLSIFLEITSCIYVSQVLHEGHFPNHFEDWAPQF